MESIYTVDYLNATLYEDITPTSFLVRRLGIDSIESFINIHTSEQRLLLVSSLERRVMDGDAFKYSLPGLRTAYKWSRKPL